MRDVLGSIWYYCYLKYDLFGERRDREGLPAAWYSLVVLHLPEQDYAESLLVSILRDPRAVALSSCYFKYPHVTLHKCSAATTDFREDTASQLQMMITSLPFWRQSLDLRCVLLPAPRSAGGPNLNTCQIQIL